MQRARGAAVLRRSCVALLCLILLPGWGCPANGRVLLVGDSNVLFSADAYSAYLYSGNHPGGWVIPSPGFLPTFAAVSGAGFKHSEDWSWSLDYVRRTQTFDAVVLNLGVNDALPPCTTDLSARIDQVMGSLPSGIPVLIVDAPYVSTPHYDTHCLVQVNLALQAAVGRWPGTHYINVNDVLNGLPADERFRDGLHFHPTAEYAIAEAVRAKLAELLY